MTPSLLGCTVTVVESSIGLPLEHIGTVVGVLQALPGSRETPAVVVDTGIDIVFHHVDDIDDLIVM
ncbi:hypothetical protein D3C84_1121090 [compost metagenome]